MVSSKDIDKNIPLSISYPTRTNRYNPLLWNRNYQDCYDRNDEALLKVIRNEFAAVQDKNQPDTHFDLSVEKAWFDYWECWRPSNQILPYPGHESYTLPAREAKDAKQYPLFTFADSTARQLANWMAERVSKKEIKLMNDPVKLAFDKILDWFFNVLSTKECNLDVINEISTWQGVIIQLKHKIPNYGSDRLIMAYLENKLQDAIAIVKYCVANKELSQILSDLITNGKSLESTAGTYLHFLPINEEVSDNYSPPVRDGNSETCYKSPVCKVYQASNANNQNGLSPGEHLFNRFYDYEKITDKDNAQHLNLKLKINLADQIKFPSFVSNDVKAKYIESIATLESLSVVRQTIEEFQDIQSQFGAYGLAVSYFDEINSLSNNYNNLVMKLKTLIRDVIESAKYGDISILTNPAMHDTDKEFEKNLQSLETRVAKGVKTDTLLDRYCDKSMTSMSHFQLKIKDVVRDVKSGDAWREIEHKMQSLYQKMRHLNTVLPAILQGRQIPLSTDNADKPPVTMHIEFTGEPCKPDNTVCPPNDKECLQKSNQCPSIDIHLQATGDNELAIPDVPSPTPEKQEAKEANDAATFSVYSYLSNMIHSFKSSFSGEKVSLPPCQPGEDAGTMCIPTEKIPAKKPIPAPVFQSTLTMNEWVQVAQYVGHYVRKYSPYTLPWNRDHDLSKDEYDKLCQLAMLVIKLKDEFVSQQFSITHQSGIFTDQYDYVIDRLREVANDIASMIESKHTTTAELDDIDLRISRVEDMLGKISEENEQLADVIEKEDKYQEECAKKGVKITTMITRNVNTNMFTCEHRAEEINHHQKRFKP